MPRGWLRRMVMSQSLTDPGWVISQRAGGRFDPYFLVGTVVPQWVMWQLGTVVGVLIGSRISDPLAYGTDALYPAFFLTLLLGGELRNDRAAAGVAALGGLIAIAMIPISPPGIPLVLSSLAAFAILFRRRRDDSGETTATEGADA